MKKAVMKEVFSKVSPYLKIWKRVEGLILLVIAFGIILPLGGRGDLVIAVCVTLWGLKKLFWG